jgi:outer membrane protein assembly factor BamB
MLAGKNDGPFTDEQYKEKEDADFIWVYDMMEELGVFPHNLASSSPVIYGDLIFCHTSNGVDEGHLNLPMPDAASFIAVNKKTGKLVWESNLPGKNVLHGQWSSPSIVVVKGKPQVLFAGGNGWLYSFEPETGKLIWKFDLNTKDAKYVLGGRGTRCYIIATPVAVGDRVYLGIGQDPEHGEGPGHFYCIDATKEGDVTDTAKVWHLGNDDFHRTLSSAAVADGLLYITDLSGFLYCVDAATGKLHWKHDTYSAIWGSPMVADGKVFLGDEQGDVLVFAHGKEHKLLSTNDMQNSVYTTPVAANGVLFISNKQSLFAIAASK